MTDRNTAGNITIVVIAAIAAVIGYITSNKVFKTPQDNSAAQTYLGSYAPTFSLVDLNDNVIDLQQFRGTPVLLNFWGTWCPPCLDEVPDLMAAHKQLQSQAENRGHIIGIAVDEIDPARNFAIDYQVNYPIVAPGYEQAMKMSISYGNTSGTYPYSVIIDREGRISQIVIGIIEREEALRYLTAL